MNKRISLLSPYHVTFWLIFVLCSAGAAFFSYHYFPKAFAIVDLTITMTREQALKKALSVAKKYEWQPEDPHSVAWFDTDKTVQYYTELEAGGVEVFKKLLHDPDYNPYTWQVRLFKENVIDEAFVIFTPTGQLYGFTLKVPQDEAGNSVSIEQARNILQQALQEWHMDLSLYTLIEEAQKTNSAGRVDYSFTYEHTDKKIGEARYRIFAKITGDRITQLTRYLKVPDAFVRRYQEMRSNNNLIASIANQFVYGLYFFIGGIGALIFLLRRRFLLWHQALLWAIIVALCAWLEKINSLPLIWRMYDTSSSVPLFLINYLISTLSQMGIMCGVFFIIFLAAEGLTRVVFGQQPQFWKSWFSSASGSSQLLGRMLGGYLWVPIFVAYTVLIYFIASRWLGWWSPADTLYNPNILATYFPWLQPLAASFLAGFSEECLFRAIPLAGAALLIKKFGGQPWWMVIAFVAQAFIFGAAHANYPAQPAYARLVELIVPSFFLGFFYLRYGLLAAIILHFTYDVFCMALPLWFADMPRIWISHLLILVGTFLPLLYGLIVRISGKEHNPPLNNAWQPQEKKSWNFLAYNPQTTPLGKPWPLPSILLGGCLGLFLFFFYADFKSDFPAVQITQKEAKERAGQIFMQQGVSLDQPWQLLPFLGKTASNCYRYPEQVSSSAQQTFIWRKHRTLFSTLLSTYLTPPTWKIRRVRFQGDTEQKAEQYILTLQPNGDFKQVCHILPEQVPGANLSQNDARKLAQSYLHKLFTLDQSQLVEIASIPTKKPDRTDWIFIWQDQAIKVEPGQARILIHLAGDQLVDVCQFIFVPQAWHRAYIYEKALLAPIKSLGVSLAIILVLLALALSSFPLAQRLSTKLLAILAFSGLSIGSIKLWNQWPTIVAAFSTTAPYYHQLFIVLSWSILKLIAISILMVCLISLVYSNLSITKQKSSDWWKHGLTGFSLAAIFFGFQTLLNHFLPHFSPHYPSLIPLLGRFEWLTSILSIADVYMIHAITASLIIIALNHLTNRGHRYQPLAAFLIILGSFALLATLSPTSMISWVVGGIISSVCSIALYHGILRFNYEPIFYLITSLLAFKSFKIALMAPYPHAWLIFSCSLASLFLLLFLSIFLLKIGEKQQKIAFFRHTF